MKNIKIVDKFLEVNFKEGLFIFLGKDYPITRQNYSFFSRYIEKRDPELLKNLNKVVLDI
jgi:hypothetical protein